MGISDFRISGQPPIIVNCHNSRTRNDIDIKLGRVTKLDKKNKRWRWRYLGNFDVILVFLIYDQFGAIWKPHSDCIVYKTYILINSNLFFCKNWKKKKKISNKALTLLLWVTVLFLTEQADFLLTSTKLLRCNKFYIFLNLICGCTYAPNFKFPA